VCDRWPDLAVAVPMHRRRKLMVEAALHNRAWIRDISGVLTVPIILQYLNARRYMDQIQLRPDKHDCISWHWMASGEYNSKSAYQAMFVGESSVMGVKEHWKAKAPNKCRFFIWLALLDPCCVRNRTLTLIEREDDTRSWGNFLVYFSHSTTMSCPLRGWGYILIGC
jgi:hypothetical protein